MAEEQEPISFWPFQKEGADFLVSHRRALLADEMGVGKSAQAVRGSDMRNAKKVLVLCPAIGKWVWEREFKKFSYMKRNFVIADGKNEITPTDSIICSYSMVEKLAPILKKFGPWPVCILDESHYLSHHDAQRTKAVFGREGVARFAHRVWCLSGTPMPNNPSDLWVMMRCFGQTQLDYDDFVARYCEYYVFKNRKCITGAKSHMMHELKYLLSQFTLRRLKVDVLKELPAIYFKDLVVEANEVDLEVDPNWVTYVSPQDKRSEFYKILADEQKLVDNALNKIGERDPNAIQVVTAICTCVPTLRRFVGMQKVKHVAEMIKRDLHDKAYSKVVIFAIHQSVIEELRDLLKDYGPVTLYGKTPDKKRQAHIDAFQQDKKTQVFIANIQAAGTSVTLTAADHVFFIEQDLVPGNNAQAAMRVHRQGQTKPVTINFVSLVNSVDEKIAQILRRKTKDIIELLDQQVLTSRESENISKRNELALKQEIEKT